eukprot:scaffold2845_cov50-Cylindrotheca_fusiformis.AAC.5
MLNFLGLSCCWRGSSMSPGDTRFSCNSRFCGRPRERLMTVEDFTHQISAFCTCGNFMHRECHNLWDRERPMNHVFGGWCTEGINRHSKSPGSNKQDDESQSDARKRVSLPPQIVFPLHRSYSGYGGRTKGEEKGRKQAESKASHALHTHNFAFHRVVSFRGQKIIVQMFETFKRLEIDELDGKKRKETGGI